MGTPVSQDRQSSGIVRHEASGTSSPLVDRPSAVPGALNVRTGLHVAVGSKNPVKIAVTHKVFGELHPAEALTVTPESVPSGVSDQPMSTEDTLLGAMTRASRVQQATGAGLGVGLEGGLTCVLDKWFCIGWVAIADASGRTWTAPGPGLAVPAGVMALVHEGLELGDAEDRYYGLTNTKQAGGLIGVVTEDRISRLDTFYMPLMAAACSMRMDLARSNGGGHA